MKRDFFDRDSVTVAKELLGWYLIHETPKGTLVGRIVETEAYHDKDPASHSFRGKTPRNSVMFGKSGIAYVYFIYGVYNCFNVVTDKENKGSAVLIRALEPIEGIELMQKFRKTKNIHELCNGPGKLTIAMNITRDRNGHDLSKRPLYLKPGPKCKDIIQTTRIGISQAKEELYRFYINNNRYISKR